MTDGAGRRQFFREGLFSILKPVAEFLGERLDLPDTPLQLFLRPPGAITEADFIETCYRCGNCVEACPAVAIKLFPSKDEQLNNTPVIDPDLAACVVCDDLSCMKACPSGALQLVSSPQDIRMGLAVFHPKLCVRTQGDDCTECIDRCPLGSTAIQLDADGLVEVLDPGCVGCGVCQFVCPTTPKAITVVPA